MFRQRLVGALFVTHRMIQKQTVVVYVRYLTLALKDQLLTLVLSEGIPVQKAYTRNWKK
jgi:hypothetical protein